MEPPLSNKNFAFSSTIDGTSFIIQHFQHQKYKLIAQ